jgi:hypothetical protein
VKITLSATRAPAYSPDPRHTSARLRFSGATPFRNGTEGISVSRVDMALGKAGDDTAQGTAARGRPV